MADDKVWQQAASASMTMFYKLAYSMLRSQADAQDAVQQMLLCTWEKRERVRSESMRAYMTRALINECRNIQRQRKRIAYIETYPQIPVTDAQENAEVYAAIEALPEKLRLPLYLKYIEDFSEAEAASALHIPVTTFKGRLHRARLRLRVMLSREVTLE